MSSACIYEDDEIKVFFHRGNSEYLLVTFGDLVTLVDGERFSADVPVKKLGITCIGFMAKKGNWYPAPSMEMAYIRLEGIIKDYKKVIGYGGSMGGYASIKFSKLLGLTHSIAFCPQWTIDRKECGGTNPGYQSYFKESMSGMAIKPGDVSGDIIVVYDPDHERDAFHARKIKDTYPATILQKSRSSDHHVTLILAGSKNLEKMLRLVYEMDYKGFQDESSKIRRAHPRRAKILLLKSARRHPGFVRSLFENPTSLSRFDRKDLIEAVGCSLDESLRAENSKLSVALINILLGLDLESERKCMLNSLLTRISQGSVNQGNASITTAHGTQLYYSASCGKLIHLKLENVRPWHERTRIYGKSGKYWLAIERNGLFWLISSDRYGSVNLVDPINCEAHQEPIIKAVIVGGYYNLMRAEMFVSCEPTGEVMYNRAEPKAWERFR